MSKFFKTAVISAIAAAAPAAFAASGTTNLSFDAAPGYYTSTPAMSVNQVKISGMTFSVSADELGIAGAGVGSFAAYCLDWSIPLNLPGAYNYSDTTLDSVARLFAVTGFNGLNYATDAVVTNMQQAALQLAIWEASEDGLAGFDLDSGGFSLISSPAATKALANQYLTQAAALSNGSYYSQVRVFYSAEARGNQPLVTTVPEPSTYAMLAACLGVIGLVMRRKSA
jgi:PEP-CTERM motif